jgi:hypothetical protein
MKPVFSISARMMKGGGFAFGNCDGGRNGPLTPSLSLSEGERE